MRTANDKSEVRENKILAALPLEEFERLLPHLEPFILPPGEILYNYDDVVTHLYFPNRNTIVSALCVTDERVHVEVALIGNEGAVGLTGLLEGETSPFQHLVEVPGSASRLRAEIVRKEFRQGSRLQPMLLRYIHALLVQIAQTALCNRLHSDEERLARWLLLSQDRVESNQLPLPRELLAKMLGKNTSSVNITTAILQTAGLIKYNGAELTIVDREGLEAVACSCYWAAKRQLQDLLKF